MHSYDVNGILFISQFIVQEKQIYIINNVGENFFLKQII